MKKLLLLLTSFCLFACSGADMYDVEGVSKSKESNSLNQNVQLSSNNKPVYYKIQPKMFINLSYYEYPQNAF